MKRVFSMAWCLAWATLSVSAWAGVFDSETTTTWFAVDTSTLSEGAITQSSVWTRVPTDGEATVADGVIGVDTDYDDQLTYTPGASAPEQSVTRIHATFTVDGCTAAPDVSYISDAQAAFLAVTNETAGRLEWVGLVYEGGSAVWKTFANAEPEINGEYELLIELDGRASAKLVRYSIRAVGASDYTVLKDSSDTSWFVNGINAYKKVASVSFAGCGSLGDFDGVKVEENVATWGANGYTSVEAAIDAAKATWTAANPVVLLKDGSYTPSAACTLYVNANGHSFTVGGDFIVRQSGVTYTVLKGAEIDKTTTTLANGYDFTNKTVRVTFGAPHGTTTATMTVRDASGTTVATVSKTVASAGSVDFGIGTDTGLVPGKTYDYTVTVTSGGATSDTMSGTFTTANENAWIEESATTQTGGTWDPTLTWSEGVSEISGSNALTIAQAKQTAATGKLVTVDVNVTYPGAYDLEDLADISADVQGALVIVTNVTSGGALTWYGVVDGAWQALSGATPTVPCAYKVRAQFDYTASPAKVSYLVAPAATSADLVRLTYGGSCWFAMSTSDTTLKGVTLSGNGTFGGLVGNLANANVAAVNGTGYATLSAALDAANGNNVVLLTDVTWVPNRRGSWTVLHGGNNLLLYGADGYYTDYANGLLRAIDYEVAQVGLETFGYLDKAFEAVAGDGLVTLLTNIYDSVALTAPAYACDLDLAGFDLILPDSVTCTIPQGGTLTITNSAAVSGCIEGSFANGDGTLKIAGGCWTEARATAYAGNLLSGFQFLSRSVGVTQHDKTFIKDARYCDAETAKGDPQVVVIPNDDVNRPAASAVVTNAFITKYLTEDQRKSGATIATGLNAPRTEGNKMPLIHSYVLGLDPDDSTSVPKVTQAQSATQDKVSLSLGNVKINKSANVPVTYSLETASTPDFTGSSKTDRQDEPTFEADTPAATEGKVRYYRINIHFGE